MCQVDGTWQPCPCPETCGDILDERVCEATEGCTWQMAPCLPCECEDESGDCNCLPCDEGVCVPEEEPAPCVDLDEQACRARDDCVWDDMMWMDSGADGAPRVPEPAGLCRDRDEMEPCEDLDEQACRARDDCVWDDENPPQPPPPCDCEGRDGDEDCACAQAERIAVRPGFCRDREEPLPDDCGLRTPEQCEADGRCELVDIDGCWQDEVSFRMPDEDEEGDAADPVDCWPGQVCVPREILPEDCAMRDVDQCQLDGRCVLKEEEVCWFDEEGMDEPWCDTVLVCEAPEQGDRCSRLAPRDCEAAPDCHLERNLICEGPQGPDCGPDGDCGDCFEEVRCVANQDCWQLDEDQCAARPDCQIEEEEVCAACGCACPVDDPDCQCDCPEEPECETVRVCVPRQEPNPCNGLGEEDCIDAPMCEPVYAVVGPCDCPDGECDCGPRDPVFVGCAPSDDWDCVDDQDCAPDQMCVDGVCMDWGIPCDDDAACPEGMQCDFCPPDPNCPMCDVCGPPVCIPAE